MLCAKEVADWLWTMMQRQIAMTVLIEENNIAGFDRNVRECDLAKRGAEVRVFVGIFWFSRFLWSSVTALRCVDGGR